jgi:hypothetical protein
MKKVQVGKQIFVPLLFAALLWSAGESFAQSNGPKVTLMVKDKSERDKDRKEDIKEDVNGNEVTTTTDRETESCMLTLNIKQSGEPRISCQLEWYFLSENTKNAKDKGTTVIFSPGKKDLSLQDNVVLEESITSEPFVLTSISRSNADSDDKISGDVYKGYIVLVRQGGEILAKASNSSRYLKDEWIVKCKPTTPTKQTRPTKPAK